MFVFSICDQQFQGRYSKHILKFIYKNNRVFLPPYHKFRNSLKNQFDGKVENRGPPLIMGLGDWIKKYEYVEFKYWEVFLIEVIQLKNQNKL